MRLLWIGLLLSIISCQNHKSSEPEEELFILHAQEAIFTRDPVDESLGKLEMDDVESQVAYFTPPPNRKAGEMKLYLFIERWEKQRLYLKQPPSSAGFIFYDIDREEYSHEAVEILLPTYDPETKKLTITVRSLREGFPVEKRRMKEVTFFLSIRL